MSVVLVDDRFPWRLLMYPGNMTADHSHGDDLSNAYRNYLESKNLFWQIETKLNLNSLVAAHPSMHDIIKRIKLLS